MNVRMSRGSLITEKSEKKNKILNLKLPKLLIIFDNNYILLFHQSVISLKESEKIEKSQASGSTALKRTTRCL